MNWQELSATSHYQTAVAVEQALQNGDVPEASAGIQELNRRLVSIRKTRPEEPADPADWFTSSSGNPSRKKRSRSWRQTIPQCPLRNRREPGRHPA